MSTNMDIVILAGGTGSRLWPFTISKPKPLLRLFSEKSLIEQTVNRVQELGTVHILAEKEILDQTRPLLGDTVNYIEEPAVNDTACAINHATCHLNNSKLILFLPADQLIPDPSPFIHSLPQAKEYAETGGIVAFGVKARGPETGFGYIETGAAGRILKFTEKPNLVRARSLVQNDALWNTGMYLAKPQAFQNSLQGIDLSKGLSFDKLIMETATDTYVVPVDMNFDDLGTWKSIVRHMQFDENGNHISENVDHEDLKNCVVLSSNIPVKVSGVENLLVVATKDGLLITPRESL